MAKTKVDIDKILNGEDVEDQTVEEDQETIDEPDLNKQLEQLKRERAGQDRKNSELLNKLAELEKQMGNPRADSEDAIQLVSQTREKLAEMKGLERSIRQQGQALEWAIENRVPPSLAIANCERLDELEAELDEIDKRVKGDKSSIIRGNLARTAHTPRSGGTPTAGGDSFITGLSVNEEFRIPERIRERLKGGK